MQRHADRCGAAQSLDLCLLIHAHRDRLLGRGHVEADEVADLRFRLAVDGELERLHAVRLSATPDFGDHGVGQTQFPPQQSRRSVRHAQPGRRPAVVGQHGKAVPGAGPAAAGRPVTRSPGSR